MSLTLEDAVLREISQHRMVSLTGGAKAVGLVGAENGYGGGGRERKGSCCSMGIGFRVCKMKSVLEICCTECASVSNSVSYS